MNGIIQLLSSNPTIGDWISFFSDGKGVVYLAAIDLIGFAGSALSLIISLIAQKTAITVQRQTDRKNASNDLQQIIANIQGISHLISISVNQGIVDRIATVRTSLNSVKSTHPDLSFAQQSVITGIIKSLLDIESTVEKGVRTDGDRFVIPIKFTKQLKRIALDIQTLSLELPKKERKLTWLQKKS